VLDLPQELETYTLRFGGNGFPMLLQLLTSGFEFVMVDSIQLLSQRITGRLQQFI
jgi:hypothetical protein